MTTYSNVDPDEIAKFEALASRWWDENSEFKPLHDINPLRASWIDQFSEVRDKKLIDVGCGGGLLSEAMAHRGATVTGIDMGEAPLSVAKIHLLESKLDIEYRQTTAETIAEEHPATYDVVTCLEMLEHVPDPSKVIQACADMAKPGADLYFSTINRNPKAWLFAIVGAEYVLNLLPKGTHEYEKFIKPSELARWARAADLTVEAMIGLTYNPITKHYRLVEGRCVRELHDPSEQARVSQRVFDAFVFDLDGTLVDTAGELIAAYQKLCVELGGGEKPFDAARKLISHGSGRLVTEATGVEEGDPRWELYRQQYLDWYEELLGSTAQPYDGLVEALHAAHSAGKQWGVVTNKYRRFAEPLMNEMPFEPSAGVLVTPCDVTHAKPHPEPVLLAASELNVSPEAMVYIGDHIRDIESGNAAGCFTVAVKYGYIEDHDNPEQWGADLCVDSPQALCHWIRSQL